MGPDTLLKWIMRLLAGARIATVGKGYTSTYTHRFDDTKCWEQSRYTEMEQDFYPVRIKKGGIIILILCFYWN